MAPKRSHYYRTLCGVLWVGRVHTASKNGGSVKGTHGVEIDRGAYRSGFVLSRLIS